MKIVLGWTLAACLAGMPAARAQRDEGASLGARLGVHLSFFHFNGAKSESQPGLSAGLFSKAPVTDHLYIQPEISATMERVRVTRGTHAEVNLRFVYTEVAFLGVYNVTERLALHAGPFIEYLVNMGRDVDAAQDTLFARDRFNDVNFGLVYGAAWEFSRVDVGLRYNHGLFVIGKEWKDGGTDADLLGTKNSFLQLYGAYLF